MQHTLKAFQIPHQNHQVVEREVNKNSIILLSVFLLAYTLNFASPLVAEILGVKDSFKQHPFPLHGQRIDGKYADVLISDITYIDYVAKSLGWVVVIVGLFLTLPNYRGILFFTLVLYIGYCVEFWLIYADPALWLGIIPIGYSTIAAGCYSLIILYRYLKA